MSALVLILVSKREGAHELSAPLFLEADMPGYLRLAGLLFMSACAGGFLVQLLIGQLSQVNGLAPQKFGS